MVIYTYGHNLVDSVHTIHLSPDTEREPYKLIILLKLRPFDFKIK